MNAHVSGRSSTQTREWRSMSRHIRQRDNWLCTSCRPRRVAAELVHHIVPLSENGEPLKESNLTSLCADCHRQRHGQVVDKGKQEWVTLHQGFNGEIIMTEQARQISKTRNRRSSNRQTARGDWADTRIGPDDRGEGRATYPSSAVPRSEGLARGGHRRTACRAEQGADPGFGRHRVEGAHQDGEPGRCNFGHHRAAP